jgi:hypothetical protein
MNKCDELFNFKQYNSFDIEPIKNYIVNFSEEWNLDNSRQDKFYPHKDTTTYFIYETSLEWDGSIPYSVEQKTNDSLILELVDPIIKYLEHTHEGQRGQVLLIRLKANKSIADHKDGGHYLMNARRHHIPIITSDKTKFYVAGEERLMKSGECWEINNAKEHAVINDSDIDRVHLLIDIMPNAVIKK